MPSALIASAESEAFVYVADSVPRPGVGSNVSQPCPANQASTQACASWSVTVHVPSFHVPLVNPTATRAGMPRYLSISAIVPANCWQ